MAEVLGLRDANELACSEGQNCEVNGMQPERGRAIALDLRRVRTLFPEPTRLEPPEIKKP